MNHIWYNPHELVIQRLFSSNGQIFLSYDFRGGCYRKCWRCQISGKSLQRDMDMVKSYNKYGMK